MVHVMAEATIREHALGLTWTIKEPMRRSSHALVQDGRVWLIDPVDQPEAIEQAAALGEIAGVVQLLDRHVRDCEALARRFGVAHERPGSSAAALAGSQLRPFDVINVPKWRERALWWARPRALIVAEAIGTVGFFTGGRSSCGVHLFLRLKPPRILRDYAPDHLLVGHGAPLHGPGTAEALSEALRRSRRDLPRVLPRVLRTLSQAGKG
jgi:hypothetical protein